MTKENKEEKILDFRRPLHTCASLTSCELIGSSELALALGSAFAGALLAVIASRLAHPRKPHTTPEKFIPAQTLTLQDRQGRTVATLNINPDRWFNFYQFTPSGEPLMSVSSGGLLTIYGSGTPRSHSGSLEVLTSSLSLL